MSAATPRSYLQCAADEVGVEPQWASPNLTQNWESQLQ